MNDLTSHSYEDVDTILQMIDSQYADGLINQTQRQESMDMLRELILTGQVEDFLEFIA